MTTARPASSSQRAVLSSRRLWIVVGKGGTGRSTLAATLAVAAARSGLRTLAVATSGDATLRTLLEAEGRPGRPGRTWDPTEIEPGLERLCIEPEEAFAEYLELYLPLGRLGARLLRHPGFQRFLDAAPGWRDLVSLGKIWSLEQELAAGRPRYDTIVVDAPATGHGLSFLSVPRVVLDTVGSGPLRRQTQPIQDLLLDARRTCYVPVTLAEELPVRETLSLCEQLTALGIAIGPLFANRQDPPFELDAAGVCTRLDALDPQGAPPLAEPGTLSRAVEHQARRAALQRHWLDVLETKAERRALRLPCGIEPIEDRGGIERLADALDLALEEAWA